MRNLFKFWSALGPVQRTRWANLSAVSHQVLYNIRTGRRNATPETATKLVNAANRIRSADPALPPLRRADISETCRNCPHSRG